MTIYRGYSDSRSARGSRQKRNAIIDPDALWPDNVIPYEISTAFFGRMLKIEACIVCTT